MKTDSNSAMRFLARCLRYTLILVAANLVIASASLLLKWNFSDLFFMIVLVEVAGLLSGGFLLEHVSRPVSHEARGIPFGREKGRNELQSRKMRRKGDQYVLVGVLLMTISMLILIVIGTFSRALSL